MFKNIFTSESVTEGHPDKICDQISDAVLDEILKQDSEGRVACEVMASTNTIIVAGEITSKAKINPSEIAKQVLKDIGYTDENWGIDYKTCKVINLLNPQSPDIAQGVSKSNKDPYECIGAGDQGSVFGFACNETEEFMPLPITIAHKLTQRLASDRKNQEISWLRPDGKSQVSVEYFNSKPYQINNVVVSTQHNENIDYQLIKQIIKDKIIMSVLPPELIKDEISFYINPTGKFVCGGPKADAGLTGRKIMVDTYGGYARHGGGCFSGKDPTKVDRSGAYMARFIAKNLVANNLAEKIEIQISYVIGISHPVSVLVQSFGTSKKSDSELIKIINKNFDLRPAAIIERLELKNPIYTKTASYGHFGRTDISLPWEQIIDLDIH
ncbi:methionine adenosyltransferase [bacterium CG_4_10_14_0_2_um_filter_33_32]|nr:MAG: methionine adenosyltransferase [bacterium CG2_30_33_46]PIR67940.1 MAG: methionine adenosyltransferase [bacterium CG10_big_fil_rev_8_21_14_0_10_33_18]PIU76511.1 MAG: methionine adenosyltransferase [bacterium CG06_land_8_20_14_3_00_33_50]PIW81574.1 MAG: methionine adenosyltransferase [bacterium CG_4_8_14_3_um_filter_33_28]PIY85118.1 MAG: methionine adenosyltransferase [bacterium CG_4_10_14_0_8_um_filter_33_57]PIZ85211.1 MAG: methionine adenosyltransferase [bacterium CG_4_10_14_0_2_um_fil